MKRVNNLYEKLISDENIILAIHDVNKTHRTYKGKINKVVIWIKNTIEERIIELRNIILNGKIINKFKNRKVYDSSAMKWRNISEPLLYPDQYIHHMIVQVLIPIISRGMDYWCCGSVPGRGTSHGCKGIERWIRNDIKNTKYAAELDIHHFYESVSKETVMIQLKHLVKDNKFIEIVNELLSDGLRIGTYYSQWFANMILQPLDHYIREILHIKHYIRYMDNLTLFDSNKRKLKKAIHEIEEWLILHGMRLNNSKQLYPTSKRMVSGMGFRYSKNKTLIRKHTLLRLKRQLKRVYKKIDNHKKISFKQASGLMSRIGMIKNSCNCEFIKRKYIRKGLIKILRKIIREYSIKINNKFNNYKIINEMRDNYEFS